MIYVIALDLAQPERNAERVGAWLKRQFPDWAEPQPGLWIVEGPLAGEQIHNGLAPLLEPTDRLTIVKAGTEALWQGVSEDVGRWLADHFPGSITNRIPGATEGIVQG
jgi:hypothetical protein